MDIDTLPSFEQLRDWSYDPLRRLFYDILVRHEFLWVDFECRHRRVNEKFFTKNNLVDEESLEISRVNTIKGMMESSITWKHFNTVIVDIFKLKMTSLSATSWDHIGQDDDDEPIIYVEDSLVRWNDAQASYFVEQRDQSEDPVQKLIFNLLVKHRVTRQLWTDQCNSFWNKSNSGHNDPKHAATFRNNLMRVITTTPVTEKMCRRVVDVFGFSFDQDSLTRALVEQAAIPKFAAMIKEREEDWQAFISQNHKP